MTAAMIVIGTGAATLTAATIGTGIAIMIGTVSAGNT
jgi:hypothetical protein